MVTVVLVATGDVVIVNEPVKPVAVVVAGTLATDGLLLVSEITAATGLSGMPLQRQSNDLRSYPSQGRRAK